MRRAGLLRMRSDEMTDIRRSSLIASVTVNVYHSASQEGSAAGENELSDDHQQRPAARAAARCTSPRWRRWPACRSPRSAGRWPTPTGSTPRRARTCSRSSAGPATRPTSPAAACARRARDGAGGRADLHHAVLHRPAPGRRPGADRARLRPADRQSARRRREGGARWSIWSAPVRSTGCSCSTATSCAAPRGSLADVGVPDGRGQRAADRRRPAGGAGRRNARVPPPWPATCWSSAIAASATSPGPPGSYIEAERWAGFRDDAGGGRHRRRRPSSAIPAIFTSRSGVEAGEPFLRARRRGRPRSSPSAT